MGRWRGAPRRWVPGGAVPDGPGLRGLDTSPHGELFAPWFDLEARVRSALPALLAADRPFGVDTAAAVRESYDYENTETCAVDGMCAVACPLGINTGDLVRRLRAEQVGPAESLAWRSAARAWAGPPSRA